jgi:hypothetical protein
LIVLGGGFYYYWFYIRKLPTAPAPTSFPAQTAAPSQNKTPQNVQSFPVDPSAGAGEFQTSFQKMASDFLVSASENSLIETRPVDKNNQQISAKDFMALSSLNLPETIAQKLSSDNYGLFLKKENSEIRTGLVFKLSSLADLTNELLLEEKNFPSRISFLYLDQKPASAEPMFNSSKYKNADIRYYNFPSPPNASLDYSVISGKDASYLILATSKETLRSILDYMSEK